jgi:glycosyltransferase involved in cell wall biosynthesis
MNAQNAELAGLIRTNGLEGRVHLLDQRDDVPDIMSALDLNVLSSAGEAFPNVLAEAMACGVPSVTTDVGDARLIVGDTGWVVPPKDPAALAEAIAYAVAEIAGAPGVERARRCRLRVVEKFRLSEMIGRYEALWSSLLESASPAPRSGAPDRRMSTVTRTET